MERMPPEAGLEQAVEQSQTLFRETFGSSPERTSGAAFHVPVQAEHTDYFPGFALLVTQPWGVGVSLARGEKEGGMTVAGGHADLLRRALEVLLDRLAAEESLRGLQVAVTSTNPREPDATFLVAALAALMRGFSVSLDSETNLAISESVRETVGRPFGPAHTLSLGSEGPVVLVDTATSEQLALGRPEGTGFALIELEQLEEAPAGQDWARAALVDESIQRLRSEGGFAGLASLRSLEHRDLPSALRHLDPRARELVGLLVMEDRRVPRMVAALRRGDNQIFGALMLMSHAARTEYFPRLRPGVNAIIEAVETTEGIYGARLVGQEHCNRVLVFGRSFLLPDFLDAIAERVSSEHGITPRVSLL